MGRTRQEIIMRIQVAQFLGPRTTIYGLLVTLHENIVRPGQSLRCQAVVLRMEASGSPRCEFVAVMESSCITHDISNQP